MGASPGIRERKKERTRQAIVAAAMRLFDERGFDDTTIADIAAAADIAPRTFFGYFAGKEDVLFADAKPVLEQFQAALEERPPGETTFEALRRWFDAFMEHEPETVDYDRITAKVAACVPSVAGRELAIQAEFERTIAAGVARDLGLDEPDLRARMVAAATVTAFRVASELKHEAGPEERRRMLDEVLSFVQNGVAGLTRER